MTHTVQSNNRELLRSDGKTIPIDKGNADYLAFLDSAETPALAGGASLVTSGISAHQTSRAADLAAIAAAQAAALARLNALRAANAHPALTTHPGTFPQPL